MKTLIQAVAGWGDTGPEAVVHCLLVKTPADRARQIPAALALASTAVQEAARSLRQGYGSTPLDAKLQSIEQALDKIIGSIQV